MATTEFIPTTEHGIRAMILQLVDNEMTRLANGGQIDDEPEYIALAAKVLMRLEKYLLSRIKANEAEDANV